MSTGTTIEKLKTITFFDGLDDNELRQLVECVKEEEYELGHLLFFEGDPANHFYVIVEGNVELEMGAGSLGFVALDTLGDNQPIGWSWMIPPYRWSLTARAKSQVKALVFNGKALRAACKSNDKLTFELMMRTASVMSKRLEATRRMLLKNLA